MYLCLSFPSCCHEKPLCAWLDLPAAPFAPASENPCPDAVGKGDGGAQQSGIFWGCWMRCGGTEEGRAGPCRAVPSRQDLLQPGMGMWGRVSLLSGSRMDGVARQLPAGGEAGTKRELPGPPFLQLHPNPLGSGALQRPWGHLLCPSGRCHHPTPQLPQARGFAGGWTRGKETSLSRGCEMGLGAAGMGRVGAQHPAGAGQEDQPQASATSDTALPQNLPQNLPRHLPWHAGARSSPADGGSGGVWQPPQPAHPARGGTQPQGCQGGGSRTHPRPFPTLRWVQRTGLGVRGWLTPQQGTLGRVSALCPWAGMGELCECAGGKRARGCEAAQGGAVGLCPLVAVCDRGVTGSGLCPPGCRVCVRGGCVVVPRGCDRGMRGDGCGGA